MGFGEAPGIWSTFDAVIRQPSSPLSAVFRCAKRKLEFEQYILRWQYAVERPELATHCGGSRAAFSGERSVELEHGRGSCEPLVPQPAGDQHPRRKDFFYRF